jgi:D-apionolactonase
MLPKNVLYYGEERPLPPQQSLRAGPLSLLFEGGDLRYLRWGDREILRRVYVAVRDRNWGTVPGSLANLQVQTTRDTFRISFDVEHRREEIDFAWMGTITGDAEGTIQFKMDGEARSTFLRNRIGFCVLHPGTRGAGGRECSGQPCEVERIDGSVERGAFPEYISPHQPFMEMRAIAHEVLPGVRAEVRFSGDTFEMEDQRNWTDASFKTYCTPLSLPYPVEVRQGTRVSQLVTLTLTGADPRQVPELRTSDVTVSLTGAPPVPLPRIGLGVASHGRPLTERELARLRTLNLSHLRIDLRLAHPDCPEALRQAAAEARALGVPLEVALHLSDAAADELQALKTRLEVIRPAICTWLIFHSGERSTSPRWIELAREHLKAYDPKATIAAGTNADFTELNRERPPAALLDAICYSINPQVHAFDNASLVETLEAQASTVASARQFSDGKPILVTPITLRQRFNPNATGPEPDPRVLGPSSGPLDGPEGREPGALPAAVDPRQMSLFGAGWTAGSLKYLAESGVAGVTYYETTGWRGVMETEEGSPLPEQFRSLPGGVFPLYHVLADLGEFAGGEVMPTRSSHSLQIDGLTLRKDAKTRTLIANLSPEPQRVRVQVPSGRVRISLLDETNVEEAMQSPETFHAREGELVETGGGEALLDLRPYGVARIDSA